MITSFKQFILEDLFDSSYEFTRKVNKYNVSYVKFISGRELRIIFDRDNISEPSNNEYSVSFMIDGSWFVDEDEQDELRELIDMKKVYGSFNKIFRDFFRKYPRAIVHATGDTAKKMRVYKKLWDKFDTTGFKFEEGHNPRDGKHYIIKKA